MWENVCVYVCVYTEFRGTFILFFILLAFWQDVTFDIKTKAIRYLHVGEKTMLLSFKPGNAEAQAP